MNQYIAVYCLPLKINRQWLKKILILQQVYVNSSRMGGKAVTFKAKAKTFGLKANAKA